MNSDPVNDERTFALPDSGAKNDEGRQTFRAPPCDPDLQRRDGCGEFIDGTVHELPRLLEG